MARVPEDRAHHLDMRVIFWTWVGMITVGLAVMIVLPLAGR